VPWLLLALLVLALIPLGVIALRGIGVNDPGGNNRRPPVAGKVKVPDVREMLQQRAEAKLQRAGLEVGIIARSKSDRIAPGRVIEPGYPVGKKLDRGTAVNLTVSSGPSVAPTSSASSSATSSATSSASSSASSQPTEQFTPASSASSSPTTKPGNAKSKSPAASPAKRTQTQAGGNSGKGKVRVKKFQVNGEGNDDNGGAKGNSGKD